MKRIMILGLVAMLSVSTLVSCGKKDGSVSSSNTTKQEEKKEELSPEEQEFQEFIKSDLSEEEKVKMFNEKLEKVKAIYDRDKIAYEDVKDQQNFSSNPNVIGITFEDGNIDEPLKTSLHHFYLSYPREEPDKAEYMFLGIMYKMDYDKTDAYKDGTDKFDISVTNFPELYKEVVGEDLNVELFNENVSKLFMDEIGSGGISAFDIELEDLGFSSSTISNSFMYVSATYSDIYIKLRVPLK